MAYNPQQQSWCALEFGKTNSVTIVQHSFRRIHHNNPDSHKSILEWYNDFIEKGCKCDQRKEHSGRPAVSEEVVERVRDSYLCSSKKSSRRYSQELQFLHRTVCKILRKRLRFTTYKLLMVQKLYLQDK
ncbi:hypothetical protein PoB_001540500 [Plakobranchus ocellatus]|uniref:DUF4817 domain-containing protein n=1 Tax=Plakobranchus ocellatus TaxID=259542 RepID=A0AAV3Z2Q7_9GAST|nr:hypothetical protein PoB_001540500 [Plakobranchus ocellatus]